MGSSARRFIIHYNLFKLRRAMLDLIPIHRKCNTSIVLIRLLNCRINTALCSEKQLTVCRGNVYPFNLILDSMYDYHRPLIC